MKKFEETGKRGGRAVWHRAALLVVLLCLLCPGFGRTAKAAKQYEGTALHWGNYRVCVGGLYFWTGEPGTSLYCAKSYTASGSRIWTAGSGESMRRSSGETGICSNGRYVYFAVYGSGGAKTKVMRLDIKTGKAKKICTYKNSYGAFLGYYKNQVLTMKPSPENETWGISVYSYNTKTRKFKAVKKNIDGNARQYGKYLVFSEIHGAGAYPAKLGIHNIASGKSKKISNCASMARIVNGKVYFAEEPNENTGVIKCATFGGKKKTLTPKFSWKGDVFGELMLGTKYAVLGMELGNTHEYYKVTYNSRKVKAISKSEYQKFLKKNYDKYCAFVFW